LETLDWGGVVQDGQGNCKKVGDEAGKNKRRILPENIIKIESRMKKQSNRRGMRN
jgi:hypothetical protein